MRTDNRRRENEAGQVLAIVAGGVTTLLLILGLVLDGGVAVLNRRDAQNIADIASLAGAKDVANFHTGAPRASNTWSVVKAAAEANGCNGVGVPCTWQAWYVGPGTGGPADISPVTQGGAVPSTALGVRVGVNRQPGTYFAGLAGIHNWNVSTQASAIAYKPRQAPAGALLPITMKENPAGYEPGQVYDLTDGKDAPGGFGYLSWTGLNSAGSLGRSLCDPDNPSFVLPTTFPADPGTTNADVVRSCLDRWISSKQTVLIPIYSVVQGTGNGAIYRITAVASFVITARDQPAVNNIRGYFVEIFPFTDPIPGGTGSRPPAPTDTSYDLTLVR
jgi:hypothetical protein